MADEAKINEALLTLQRVLLTYSSQNVSGIDMQLVDGQLPQGLFENIAAFIRELTGIEDVSRSLHGAGHQLMGAYDPAVGDALQAQLGGQSATALDTVLQNEGEDAARVVLRSQDAPEILSQNPELMVQFVQSDLAPMIEALDTLAAEDLLDAPPVASELLTAQPAATSALESTLDEHLDFYAELLNGQRDLQNSRLAELSADASAEDRAAITNSLAWIDQASTLISTARTEFDAADFSNFQDDQHAQNALAATVEYLQTYNLYAAAPDRSGVYSSGFEGHLKGVLETNAALIEDLNGRTFPSATQELHRDMLNRLTEFEDVMAEMVRTQVYIQPVSIQTSTDPVERARPIIEDAIDYMERKGKTAFNPVLGEADGGAFDYESRLALQAFLIDLQTHLQIDNDTLNGAYSAETRAALLASLQDPAHVQSVAQEFFKGDETKVAGLIEALDTYSNPALIADIQGIPSNIASVNLLVLPEVKPSEIAVLDAAINRIPADELAAMNELAATLSGFGFNQIMPAGTFSEEQNSALSQAMHNRSQVLAELFEKVYADSQAAIIREGRPSEDIEAEMKERLAERLESILGGHGVYDPARRDILQDYIDQAVTQGLQAYNTIGSNDEERLQAASSVFAGYIPSTANFLQSHGVNERAYGLFSRDRMEGVTPHAIAGFAGALENKTLAEPDVISTLPSINALIDEMEGEFPDMRYSPIAQQTLSDVRDQIEENRILLENIYHEAIASDGAAEDTPLVVHDAHGESVLIAPQEDGSLKISYLDAHGYNGINDPALREITVTESFGYDGLMIQAALAGFQSHNQSTEYIDNYNPEFFTVAGRSYVVGIEDETQGLQIIPLDPALISSENSAAINDYNNPALARETVQRFNEDPAYNFVKRNYGAQFGGSTDAIFESMAEELAMAGHAQAQEAQRIFEERPLMPGAEITPPPPSDVPPLEGEARELALRSAFESAAGFVLEYKDVTLGEPIADTGLLTEMLGYDPNEIFATSRYDNPEASYVVHGLEPEIWNGEHEVDPFLRDHVIVTFMQDNEIQSIAIKKTELENNPLRLPTILQNGEGLEQPITVYAADRFSATLVEGLGVTVNTNNIWGYVQRNLMRYGDGPGVEPYPSGPVTPRFWSVDGGRYQESHGLKPEDVVPEEDHTMLPEPIVPVPASSKLTMFAQSMDEITLPVEDFPFAASGGGMAPQRQVALASMKV